jgi:antirestriction protein ArdC
VELDPGINSFVLNSLAFDSPYWLTFKQAKDLGGNVKRGEHGTPVIFWKWLDREKDDGKRETFPMLRYYTVFNAAQCEGLADKLPGTPATREILPCESVIASYRDGPGIHIDGGDRAFYRPSTDSVHMPARESFESPESWYSILFHELTHSTGHEKRLARFEGPDQFLFASTSYSKEELVAEMGAAFLCGETGISQDVENSAAYLASWLRALRQSKNSRLIVEAAGKAQKAADLILGRKIGEEGSAA